MKRREADNISARHGEWGEDVATEFLRRAGYEIIERNSRPVKRDQRLDIDIVAYDLRNNSVVFVEVKQHAKHSPFEKRLRSVDRRKKNNLLRACNAWRWKNSWRGSFRFDVVEVFGSPGEKSEVDHISHVELFTDKGRFVRWD
jgi:putative endonuclease